MLYEAFAIQDLRDSHHAVGGGLKVLAHAYRCSLCCALAVSPLQISDGIQLADVARKFLEVAGRLGKEFLEPILQMRHERFVMQLGDAIIIEERLLVNVANLLHGRHKRDQVGGISLVLDDLRISLGEFGAAAMPAGTKVSAL